MVPAPRWWSRTRGVPEDAYAAWRRSLPAGAGTRVLAWAATPTGFAVGSVTALSSGREEWTHLPWHHVERGTWNAENQTLSWRRLDGGRGSLELPEPGRLPELFRERVAASIVLERFVPLGPDGGVVDGEDEEVAEPGRQRRGVTVSARRDLADPGVISWHASPVRGTTWATPGAREAADDAIARLREEYDSTR